VNRGATDEHIKALIPCVKRFEVLAEERAAMVNLQGAKHLHVQVS